MIEAEEGQLEAERARDLEIQRRLEAEERRVDEIIQEGESFRKPSKLKWGFLLILAVLVDIIDFFEFTGVGYLIAKAISLIATAISLFTIWLTNTQMKRAQNYVDEAEDALIEIQENIAHYSRIAMRTARIARRVPGAKRLARQIPRGLVKIRRFARKNPFTKFLFSAIANLIPVIDLVPWMTVGVILSYLDEKKVYENANQVAIQIKEEIYAES